MSKRPYTEPGRLADVLALIQVLALDADTHRSESGIKKELQDNPISAKDWIPLAKEHPEFFRVDPAREHGLSLVARHVLPHEPTQPRPSLSPDFTSVLLRAAVDLHDRQAKVSEWRKNLAASLIGVVTGGLLTLAGTFLASYRVQPVGRFVQAQEAGDFMLLDTATGNLCYADIKGVKHSGTPPTCTDLH